MYLVLALPVQEYRIFCNNVSFWNLHCFEKRKQDSFRFLVFSKTEVKEFKKWGLEKGAFRHLVQFANKVLNRNMYVDH